jgi:O-antigen ligase
MNSPVQKTFDINTVILCILIALSPLIFKFAPIPMLGKYFGAKVQLIEVAFCILFPIWLFLMIKRGDFKPRLPRGTLFFLGFIVVAFVSSLLSVDPRRSLLDSASFLYLFVLLFLFYHLLTQKNVILSLKLFLIVSTAVIIIGLSGLLLYLFFGVQTFAVELVSYVPGLSLVRICSTFFTSNYMIVYIGFGIAVGMTFLQYGKKGWVRAVSFVLIGITSIMILSQPYRGEFVIWGTIFFGLGHFGKSTVVRFIKPIVLSLAIIFLVLFVVQGFITISPVRIHEDHITQRLDISVSTQQTSYNCLHRTAFRIFRDFPLLGVGPGLYNRFMQQEKYGFDFAAFPFHVGGADPHSTYLGYLAETGVLGTTFIVVFFGLVLRRLYILSRSRDPFFRLLGQNTLCYFTLLLVYAFYIDIVTIRFLYFMYALVFFLTDTIKVGDDSVGLREQ